MSDDIIERHLRDLTYEVRRTTLQAAIDQVKQSKTVDEAVERLETFRKAFREKRDDP